ncbi:hypothetical protein ES703_17630 [subsurface metagenome]
MMVLPLGSGITWPKCPGEKPHPIANMRSALWRNLSAGAPLTPSERGWFSGKQLFPLRVVSTGAWTDPANFSSSSHASA